MKYKVKVTCWHKCRLYEKGDIAEFGDNEVVPEHFEAIEKAAPAEVAPNVSEVKPKAARTKKK